MSEITTIAFKSCEGNEHGPAYVAYLVQLWPPVGEHKARQVILPVRFSGETEEEARQIALTKWQYDLDVIKRKAESMEKARAARHKPKQEAPNV
jgi:hypothetical protein